MGAFESKTASDALYPPPRQSQPCRSRGQRYGQVCGEGLGVMDAWRRQDGLTRSPRKHRS
eukprot:2085217-Prymnesium_polylepis.2